MANFRKKIDFPGTNCLFTAISGQIFLFLFKSHHFQTFFLYMIRYNNILRPVHDSPCPKSGGRDPPTPRIDAYAQGQGREGEQRGAPQLKFLAAPLPVAPSLVSVPAI